MNIACPSCSAANPTTAKFCWNCGTALVARCPNCGAEVPPGARFCMNCGQPVGASTPVDDARLTRIAASTPAPLAAKMRSAQAAGERKMVTALFADVVGSTALAEQMDAEDWAAIMNGAFDRLSPAIYHYEGTIARLLGDAILAFFGAPVAHEDDPVRAVRAALDLLAAVKPYAEELKRERGIDFAVRVGLSTGLVVVGDVGSDLKYEYTAMGDAVNLAARLQTAARPMTALISEQTYRFVAPFVEVADLGAIDVKGKAEPVRVYEVQRLKAEPGRARGVAGLESPMVGRDGELAEMLRAGAAVQAGLGRVVVVVGEPGLGKSRLVAEWKAAMAAQTSSERQLRWAEGHCLSYGQGLAYHLLLDLLRSLVGVPAAADEREVRAALQRLADELFAASALDVYPYLGHLLSLRLEGPALDRVRLLDPQALQAQYLAAVRALLRALAVRSPLVLVLEDIHWADPSSADLLARLLPLAGESALLFCFVTRPDRDAPGWKLVEVARAAMGAGLVEIALRPLSQDDSRQLVSNLLAVEVLPERTRTLILEKAEGNPFFVEEVIRMLIDRGAIVKQGDGWAVEREIQDVEIPANLHGLLLARIDRLPEEVKRTLRVASVIGRQFSVKVLEHVLERQ